MSLLGAVNINKQLLRRLDGAVRNVSTTGACCSNCSAHELTLQNREVRRLCTAIDQIMSSGLVFPREGYWRAVREFLSKENADEIQRNWKAKSPHEISIAWIYSALNDATIWCFFSNFRQSQQLLKKFYRVDAFLRDLSMIAAALDVLDRLQNMQFTLSHAQLTLPTYTCQRFMHSPTSPVETPSLDIDIEIAFSDTTSLRTSDARSTADAAEAHECFSETRSEIVNVMPAGRRRHRRPVASTSKHEASSSLETSVDDTVPKTQRSTSEQVEVSQEAIDFTLSFEESILSHRGPTIVVKRRKSRHLPRVLSAGTSKLPERATPSKSAPQRIVAIGTSGDDEEEWLSASVAGGEEVRSSTPVFPSVLDGTRVAPSYAFSPPKSNGSTNVSNKSDRVRIAKLYYETLGITVAPQAPVIGRSSPEGEENPKPFEAPIEANEARTEAPKDDYAKGVMRRMAKVAPVVSSYAESDLFLRSIASDELSKKEVRRDEDEVEEGVVPDESLDLEHPIEEEEKPIEAVMEEMKIEGEEEMRHEGEVVLSTAEVLDLGIHCFTNEGERLYKAYKVHVGHALGNSQLRLLVLTHHAVYVLRKEWTVMAPAVSDDEVIQESKRFEFHADTVVPYFELAYVAVGLFQQAFTLFLRKGTNYVVCTADELLTRSILSSLELAIRRCAFAIEPPNVLLDASQALDAFQRWSAAETHVDLAKSVTLHYALVFWSEVSAHDSVQKFSPTRSGYLFYQTSSRRTSWTWQKTNDWLKSFFMLRGKKLYQFADSTCKIGEKVYDLSQDVTGCRKSATKENAHCIELLLAADDASLLLACPSQHEMQQWLQTFIFSLSQAETTPTHDAKAVASCCLLTPSHLLLCQENIGVGFVRTLSICALRDVLAVRLCERRCSIVLQIDNQSEFNGGGLSLLCFACPNELRRFGEKLARIWAEIFKMQLRFDAPINDGPLLENCQRSFALWSDAE